jgi:hypothetical protein
LVKMSYPSHSPTDSYGDHGWNRYWHGGISLSVDTYQKLSTEFNNDIKQTTQSTEALQDQVDSLVAVVPRVSFALDLLTAEKGRTCLFPK